MADAADKVVADDERAMAQLEEQLRLQRVKESFMQFDPSKPVHCIDCAEPVSTERLRAFPHTRRCIGCATEIERRLSANEVRR